MSKKKRTKIEEWPSGVDFDEVEKLTRRIAFHANQVNVNVRRHSILTDLDYGYLFDTVERLYEAARVGELAEMNRARLEKEKREREAREE